MKWTCVAPAFLAVVFAVSGLARGAEADYHHVHLTAPNPEEAAQWYVKHFACESMATRKDAAQCGTVRLLFFRRAPTGASQGTGVNHIGFSFLDLAAKMKELEAGGVKIVAPMGNGRLKAAFVEDPWGTRIEVVEDPESLGFYHVHLRSIDPEATLKWYHDMFGGQLAKRKITGLDGVLWGRFWLLVTRKGEAEAPLVPTEGRVIDHLGLSFRDLDAAAAELKSKGVKFRQEPRVVKNSIGESIKVAFIVGPDDVLIELVQPLAN